MTDSRFQSVHLEGLPSRRDEFRAARQRLEDACGQYTLLGDLAELAAGDPGDGLTATISPAALQANTYFLQDGDRLHPLCVGVNSVGRLPDNQVVLRDEHVSRRHCAIVVHRDGRCEVHDVASKNGTLVNGRKIAAPTALKPGDTLLLCTRKLTFLAGPTGPEAKPAA
jgi:pSer/pThr/pTyr-binding forkhead associated (FHA) protein